MRQAANHGKSLYRKYNVNTNMANFCLPREFASKFLQSLKDGTINPDKMIDMTSAERREFLGKIVGEDNAREVNAAFESKLLLKDQKRGLVSWAKQVSGITEPVRRDILAKIDRMEAVLTPRTEDAFLEDLAAKKLGTDVTFEEAQHITEEANKTEAAREKFDPKKAEVDLAKNPKDLNAGWTSEEDRLEYGIKFVELQKFVNELKLSQKSGLKELITPSGISGVLKSIQASFDNSFFLRQGLKAIYNPKYAGSWIKNFATSWGDIGRELKRTKADIDPMDAVKADILSRPNAMNGKYKATGTELGLESEEAFPSALPEHVPLLGRLYKASETAFNGAALRMRADIADSLIRDAEKHGLNTKDSAEAGVVGTLANSLTGRGKIHTAPKGIFSAKSINNLMFSIKFLKSNYDFLTGHSLGFEAPKGPQRTFLRKQAAQNLASVVTSIAAINTLAYLMNPDSVQLDPRQSYFGQLKFGTHHVDITGGLGGLLTLAARITPTEHNGQWGLWSQSTTGKWTHLNDPKYGQQNAVDTVNSFLDGKASPALSILMDFGRGRTYEGTKPTIVNESLGAITPIPVQNFQQLNEPNAWATLGLVIADGLGASVNTQNK